MGEPQLTGLTVGLIGAGNIAHVHVAAWKALGARVLVHSVAGAERARRAVRAGGRPDARRPPRSRRFRRHRHPVGDPQGDRARGHQGRPRRDLREAADSAGERVAGVGGCRGSGRSTDLSGSCRAVLPGVRCRARRSTGGPDRQGRRGALLPAGLVAGRRGLVPRRRPLGRRHHGPDGARPRPGPVDLRRGDQRVRRTEPADRRRDLARSTWRRTSRSRTRAARSAISARPGVPTGTRSRPASRSRVRRACSSTPPTGAPGSRRSCRTVRPAGDLLIPSSTLYESPYLTQLRELAAALRVDVEPRVVAADGLTAVFLAEAARESMETGRTIDMKRLRPGRSCKVKVAIASFAHTHASSYAAARGAARRRGAVVRSRRSRRAGRGTRAVRVRREARSALRRLVRRTVCLGPRCGRGHV